jgi:hypothetical protein
MRLAMHALKNCVMFCVELFIIAVSWFFGLLWSIAKKYRIGFYLRDKYFVLAESVRKKGLQR